MNSLGVIKPDIQPHATDYITEMINLIKKMMPVYKKMTNKLIKEFIFK